MTNPYDIIIAGGGAAGLSLACHLVHSPLRDRRMLIVEQDTKNENDRTWCFWTDQPTLFDDIVSHSWNQLQVLDRKFAKTLDLHAYHYAMIRGSDFYRFARQTVEQSGQVDFLQGRVESIEDGAQAAHILVDGQSYTGAWVFDSLFNRASFQPDQVRYHCLKQQFKGWEIETQEPAFNPQIATFMDFRTAQEQGTHFFYVLPFSTRHALVESVLCTIAPVSWDVCEQAVSHYLSNILNITTYHIQRKEQGAIPLTDWPFPRQRGQHIMTIGTQGGRIKPSTGYAFLRIQQDSSAIVHSLLQVGHPFSVPASPRRYRFFDSVMLGIMTHHREKSASILTALFKHNSVERIFRFLDETAPLWENGCMVPTLPPQLLWQALVQIDALRRV